MSRPLARNAGKLISESDYLTAKTTYDVAVTTLAGAVQQVDIAAAALQSSETDLSKTTTYSPIDLFLVGPTKEWPFFRNPEASNC